MRSNLLPEEGLYSRKLKWDLFAAGSAIWLWNRACLDLLPISISTPISISIIQAHVLLIQITNTNANAPSAATSTSTSTPTPTYTLFGVVEHTGQTSDCGHYNAPVRNSKDHRFYNCHYSQIEDATDNLNGSDACNTFCSIRGKKICRGALGWRGSCKWIWMWI